MILIFSNIHTWIGASGCRVRLKNTHKKNHFHISPGTFDDLSQGLIFVAVSQTSCSKLVKFVIKVTQVTLFQQHTRWPQRSGHFNQIEVEEEMAFVLGFRSKTEVKLSSHRVM